MGKRQDDTLGTLFLVAWLMLLGVTIGMKWAEREREREALEHRVHRLEYKLVGEPEAFSAESAAETQAWLNSLVDAKGEGVTT